MKLPRTIQETQDGLLKKKFSAVELLDTYLERIRKHNQDLNAFITVTDELAYQQAKNVDKIIQELAKKALSEKPLLGVAVSHKDLFLTKGVRTTAGAKVLQNYVPSHSATVVEKMEKAGAILLGKTNCDAWAHGTSGENSDFGPTKNPWNKKYAPGGSSSGSAVSVSANFSLVATGTDTGGSIRQPASFCGIVGFKPTYGLVSRYGVIAMASSLDSIGHMSRTVEDSSRIFKIIKGEDGKDSTLKNAKLKNKNAKLKIGIPKEYFTKGINKEVEKAVLDAVKVFKKEKIEFKEVSLPQTKYAISVYYIVQPAEVSSNLARYDGVRFGYDRDYFGKEAKRRIMLGSYVLSAGYYDAYYLQAMKVRSKIIEDFEQAFKEVDVLITPVSPTPAFKLGEKVEKPLQLYLMDIFTVAANLAGIPGLALPAGITSKGLPLGFQLLGPKFSEKILFNLGKLYQKQTDWHWKEPEL